MLSDYELNGPWLGENKPRSTGNLLPRGMRIFLLLCALAVITGALVAVSPP